MPFPPAYFVYQQSSLSVVEESRNCENQNQEETAKYRSNLEKNNVSNIEAGNNDVEWIVSRIDPHLVSWVDSWTAHIPGAPWTHSGMRKVCLFPLFLSHKSWDLLNEKH